jgi:hypothetical protein
MRWFYDTEDKLTCIPTATYIPFSDFVFTYYSILSYLGTKVDKNIGYKLALGLLIHEVGTSFPLTLSLNQLPNDFDQNLQNKMSNNNPLFVDNVIKLWTEIAQWCKVKSVKLELIEKSFRNSQLSADLFVTIAKNVFEV